MRISPLLLFFICSTSPVNQTHQVTPSATAFPVSMILDLPTLLNQHLQLIIRRIIRRFGLHPQIPRSASSDIQVNVQTYTPDVSMIPCRCMTRQKTLFSYAEQLPGDSGLADAHRSGDEDEPFYTDSFFLTGRNKNAASAKTSTMVTASPPSGPNAPPFQIEAEDVWTEVKRVILVTDPLTCIPRRLP